MRRILLLILWHLGLLAGIQLFADVITLKDGRQISGSVESGNTQELHIKVGDQSQSLDIHDIQAIQFGGPLPAPAAATAAPKAPVPPQAAASEPAPAQPNNLFLKDGTRVAGKWWSIDASDMHYLVNDQLEHYPRHDVSGVTFGGATLPAPPARSTPPSAASAQLPASAARPDGSPTSGQSSNPPPQPSQPPTPARSPSAPPASQPPVLARSPSPQAQPPILTRPSESTPPSAPSRGLSQPEELGMVYFWNGKVLIPLERNQAVERKQGATEYWEMKAAKSPIRVSEASSLVFILRLPPEVNPASYSLFQLAAADGSRRTQPSPGRRGGLLTWPVDIAINYKSSLVTYAITVRDLPTGEYSFSPSSSNDGYCFGVDPSAPDQ